jgi:hypothetical protein
MTDFFNDHFIIIPVIIPVGFDKEAPVKTRSKFDEAAAEFKRLVDANPIALRTDVRRSGKEMIVTVEGTFTPGDRDAYVKADGTVWAILATLPMSHPGTVWGTDGASVGGHAGLTFGTYRLSKSGIGIRYGEAVARAVGVEVGTLR